MNIKKLSQEQKEKIGLETIILISDLSAFLELLDLSVEDKKLIMENHNRYNQEEYSMIKLHYLIEDTIEFYTDKLYSEDCDKNGNLKPKNTEQINKIIYAFKNLKKQCPKQAIYISWEDGNIWN